MSRPVVVGPGIVVAADVCPFFAPVLRRALEDAQRRHERVPGDVVETIEAIVRAGEIFSGRKVPMVPTPVPTVDRPGTGPAESISVKRAVEILNISERAVTKRIRAGTIRAEMVKGAWAIDPRSLNTKEAS